jgi:hypothetical protein
MSKRERQPGGNRARHFFLPNTCCVIAIDDAVIPFFLFTRFPINSGARLAMDMIFQSSA